MSVKAETVSSNSNVSGFTEIDVGPIFGLGDQILTDWMLQDVAGFAEMIFVVAQSVLKEIPLPLNVKLLGDPFLPFADDQPNRFS
jgi:hypothetical protein